MKEIISRLAPLDIVLVCGLPGSGKSHVASAAFKDSGRKRVNRKEIRRHLYEMTNFGAPWREACYREEDELLVKHVEHKLCEHLLVNHRKILIDNTSVTRASRRFYADLAAKFHKSIGVIYIDTAVQKCLERNRALSDPLPDSVIANLYAAVERPTEEEGFKEIIVLST
jgi:predicted kinase